MSDSDPASPLRVLVITEDDPLYVAEFFRVFLAELPGDEVAIVGMTVSAAFHEPLLKTARRILRFYGPRDFVRLGMRWAMRRLRRDTISRLAGRCGVPLLPTGSVNDAAYLERVRQLNPDLIVSVAAPEIFRAGLLGAAPQGCINIHSGRLPRYRGMMPTFWQLLHGETAVTVTIHRMVERLDAGSSLATVEVPVLAADSLDRVIRESKQAGARLMISVLRRLRHGAVEEQPLAMADAGYFKFPQPADVAAFRRRGHRMI